MKRKYIFTSVCRISDLADRPFRVKSMAKRDWSTGDYVLCEITRSSPSSFFKAELIDGRMSDVMAGDHLVGALGIRHASLEATGSWEEVGRDRRMHLLTAAGLLGKITSKSLFLPELIEVKYLGHVTRQNRVMSMRSFVERLTRQPLKTPVILIVGTSMSAGKTTAAKVLIRQLRKLNYAVVGAKLTGAGRYRDILAMKDAGASTIVDFVDAGLPSSICTPESYTSALDHMIAKIESSRADVAVIEIGASPLEPYNGKCAIAAIRSQVICTVLCASDPYAVLGVMKSFDLEPTFVSGPAVNTLAGSELIKKLTAVNTLNLLDPSDLTPTLALLRNCLTQIMQ